MRYACLTVLGCVLLTSSGQVRAADMEPIANGTQPVADRAEKDAGATTSTAGGEPADGAAIVDTEASARRESEYRRTPFMPQVFMHQWVYREPSIQAPDSRSEALEPARLTVTEAVHQALAHNPGVASQRLTPLRVLEDVRRAEAIFDPILTGEVDKDRRKSPNASALTGVRTNIQSNFNANVGLLKTLRTGGDFSIDFTNNRLKSNARFQSLIPQYEPELVFSLNQPLLRNFGLNFAYLLVDITSINSDAARYTYRAQLSDFVRRVITAYWVVVFARQNLVVQEQSLALARETLHENEERVRVGLLAPVSVKEAESQAALREENVIVATRQLDNALRTLRQIVYLTPADATVPREIDPIEEPRTTPVAVNADTALAVAFDQRPEIVAKNLDVRSKNLTTRVRENQLLPRLDFVGDVGLNGLSGDGVPVTTVDGETVVSPFTGGYGKALDRLTTKEFYSYRAGVEIEIPLGNAAARADYAQAKIDASQAELDRRQLISDITLEVGTAVNDVISNMKRIQSTRVARELAEENLRNQQKRLEVGMATTKDILDFQDDLTTARGNEVRAATDYNISLAELARAEGTILDKYSVVIEVPGKRFVPWWARF